MGPVAATSQPDGPADDPVLAGPGGLVPGSAPPVVIAHRGASGYRPEHTLAAYELAARMGADYLEPDLVSTRDHVLVARHENELGGTTDVADHPEFAERRTVREVNGCLVRGWFTEDFTLAELKTLRARERLPGLRPGNVAWDDRLEIPTLTEILDLRERLAAELQRPLGVYPETKSPSYFRSRGLDLHTPLMTALRQRGLDRPDAPVAIQSFEPTSLTRLREVAGARVPLVLLTQGGGTPFDLRGREDERSYDELTTPAGLAALAEVVDVLAPDRHQVIGRRRDGTLGAPTDLVRDAHEAGLAVHPWTFRAENAFLPTEHRRGRDEAATGRIEDELRAHLATGVDGFLTDHPDRGAGVSRPRRPRSRRRRR